MSTHRRSTSLKHLGVCCILALASVATHAQEAPATAKSANGIVFVDKVDREDVADMGTASPSAVELKAGLFPEEVESDERRRDRERCERLITAGFKCMPPARSYTRYSLPGASFAVGSAELPDLMRQQLRSFADVLKGRSAKSPVVRIDGHADASGSEDVNQVLSQRRAESVRDYLVSLGVSAGLLTVQGHGSKELRNTAAPTAAENRRVEIARNLPQ